MKWKIGDTAVARIADEQTDERIDIPERMKLEEREATVLRLRFGFDGEEPQTFTAIGEHLGVTRERARQLEQRALSKLRQLVKAG